MFDNRVGNVLGYVVIFLLLPFFVAGVACMGPRTNRTTSSNIILPENCLKNSGLY